MKTLRPTVLRPLAVVATGLTLGALLVGCGSDTTEASDTPAAGDQQAGPGGQDGQGGPGMPGTSGQIAAVDGSVLQVRSQMSGQVAVTVTDTTTVTDQVAATLADVQAGVCVVVRSADGSDGSDSGDSGDSGTSAVTAASVQVVAATDGECGAGFGPGGRMPDGDRPEGMPSDFAEGEMQGMPTDLPSDFPSDFAEGEMPEGGPGGFGGFGTAGEVSSVSSSGFVVTTDDGDVTVTVSADTTYTQQASADSAALTVGGCVRVDGDADDTGAVTATTIQVSDAVEDQCGR